MPNLTIKNLPLDVHAALKLQAERHRRSLNQEIVLILERETRRPRPDVEVVLARIREHRDRLGIPPVTDEEILAARRKSYP